MSKQSRVKWMTVALVAVLVLIGSSGYVQALGVTPGRSTIDFQPGLEVTKSFTITNNEHRAFNAYIYAEDELSQYIIFDQEILEFRESDNSKEFTYRLRLPERIDTPGDHWGKIVVMELPEGWTAPEGETRIIATIAVMHQVRLKVPYPGKYLQFEMSVQEAIPGESVKLFVKMYNLGKEDIAKSQAIIDILGPTNEVIATVEAGPASVKSMEKGELLAEWKADVNPGMYHAEATIRYDGEVGKTQKTFYVGNMLVDVTDISVKDFNLGGVAKFNILTESKWNQPIGNVYAHMVINDQNDNKVADFKSASMDMEPFEKAHLYAYWDTEGVMEGDYLAKLALHYGDRITEREIKTKVGLNSIRMDFAGGAGLVTREEDILEQYPVILLVAVLVAINLGWFLYFRKRRR
jgi:hypothetical protein